MEAVELQWFETFDLIEESGEGCGKYLGRGEADFFIVDTGPTRPKCSALFFFGGCRGGEKGGAP